MKFKSNCDNGNYVNHRKIKSMTKTMPQSVLNKMYWRGYCDDAIEHAAGTSFAFGGDERVRYMQEHHKKCSDCYRAAKFLHLESLVVNLLGTSAAKVAFEMGGELERFPGYDKALSTVLNETLASGFLTAEDVKWMKQINKRHGIAWPRHKSKNE